MINQGITKKALAKFISNSIDEEKEVALISTKLCGEMKGAGKKRPYKQMGFAFSQDFFKERESIGDFLEAKSLCVLIMKKKHLSDEFMSRVLKAEAEMKK